MAVKTKTPTSTTFTAPRIPAPASPAPRAPATRPSTSATSSRLAVSPQAVSTSQQRRSATQTPAPIPTARKGQVAPPAGANTQAKGKAASPPSSPFGEKVKAYGEGIKQSGVELLEGAKTLVTNPVGVGQALVQQIQRETGQRAAYIALAGIAAGVFKGDQQAAKKALQQLPGRQVQQIKTQVAGTVTSPYELGRLTGNIAFGVATDGAFSLVGKGLSTVGGQAMARAGSNALKKGNQVLDTMAQDMFGGRGGSGPSAAVAYAGGGAGSATLGGGRQVGNLPKGLGTSGVPAVKFMTKNGDGSSPSAPISLEQARSAVEQQIQQFFKGDQGKTRDLLNALKKVSPEDIHALYSIRDIEAAGLKDVFSQLKTDKMRPAALQSIHGAAERVARGQEVVLEPKPSTGYPEFPTTGDKSVDIDLATRVDGRWQDGVQYYKPESLSNLIKVRNKILTKADTQLINSPLPNNIIEVDLKSVKSSDFPSMDIRDEANYKVVIHFSDRTIEYKK